MLISTKLFNCFPSCQPFGDVRIESGFYHKVRHYGHKAYMDTNTELRITKRPAYPVDFQGLENEWKQWVKVDGKRRQIPDRRPLDPDDKRQVNGIYMPLGMGMDTTGIGGTNEKEATSQSSESTQGKSGAKVQRTRKPNRAERRRKQKSKD